MEEVRGPGFQAVTSLHPGADGVSNPRGRREESRVKIETFIPALFLLAGRLPTLSFLTCKVGTRTGFFPFWMAVLAL